MAVGADLPPHPDEPPKANGKHHADGDPKSWSHGAAPGKKTAEAEREEQLRKLLDSTRFDFTRTPEKPAPLLMLQDVPVGSSGNLCNLQAGIKSGKTAALGGMMAAAMVGDKADVDTLGFNASNPKGLALVHFDTEQSEWDYDQSIRRSIARAKVTGPPKWFRSNWMKIASPAERLASFELAMKIYADSYGGIFIAFIDGVADLIPSVNDEERVVDMVGRLEALAVQYHCLIYTVLHENPGKNEFHKTRGHLGSHLERKAETNLRVAKDADGISTIYARPSRNCHIPKEEGWCFSWCSESLAHRSLGMASAIDDGKRRTMKNARAASNEEQLRKLLEKAWPDSEGPLKSWTEIIQRVQANECGRGGNSVSIATAKRRLTEWQAAGWVLKDNGLLYRKMR